MLVFIVKRWCFEAFKYVFKTGFIYLIENKKDVIIYSDHNDFYLISGASLFTARFL